MEEAYQELYQEFLRLRALCLRQAALLHQLTRALHKQPGSQGCNGELGDLSVPVQCHRENQELQLSAQSGASRSSGKEGSFTDFLAEGVNKLCLNHPQVRQDGKEGKKSQVSADASSPKPADGCGGRNLLTPRMDRHFLCGDFLSHSGGFSDVALQSHVCDFCQAVFPGDTTARSEFLRHLYTHIT